MCSIKQELTCWLFSYVQLCFYKFVRENFSCYRKSITYDGGTICNPM